MDIKYGRVNTTVNLRGHKFPAGSIIKIWTAGSVTSIQPLILPTKYHGILWYSMPDIHLRHIDELESLECTLLDYGFFS
jgi:hypothetical protein